MFISRDSKKAAEILDSLTVDDGCRWLPCCSYCQQLLCSPHCHYSGHSGDGRPCKERRSRSRAALLGHGWPQQVAVICLC